MLAPKCGIHLNEQYDKVKMSLLVTNTLAFLIFKYFQHNSCVYQFGDLGITTQDATIVNFNLNLLNESLYSMEIVKCGMFVISGENTVETVNLIESRLRLTRVFRFNSRLYILVEHGHMNLTNYFKTEIFRSLANVLLIKESNNSCLDFYTHQYTGINSLETVNIGSACSLFDIEHLVLFPDKFTDLCKRELRIATMNYIPYVDLDLNKGAEWSMMNAFIERYNYTKRLINGTKHWGELYDNLTGTGISGLVVTGAAEIGVSCFYSLLHRQYGLDLSTATMRNALTFLVPKPKLLAGLDVPLKPFQFGPWCLFLFTLLLFVILSTVANKFYKWYKGDGVFGKLLLLMIGTVLQQNVAHRIRLLGILALYYGMLMTAFYNSALSSIMTKPSYDEHIRFGRDLDASNLNIYGLSDSYVSGLNMDMYGNIKNKFIEITPEDFYIALKYGMNLALAIDHLDLGYSIADYNAALSLERLEEFVLLEEDLSYDACTMIGYKHSVIMPLLNAHILRLKESGLDYFWQAESFRNIDQKKNIYLNSGKSQDPQFLQLKIKHISGALVILAGGHVLAVLIFIGENLSRHRGRKKNRKRTRKIIRKTTNKYLRRKHGKRKV